MLKPTHIQLVTKMSDGSAVAGSPSQSRARASRPSARRPVLMGPQS